MFLSTDDYYYDYYNGIVVGEEEETRKEIHLCSSQKEKEEKEKKRIKKQEIEPPQKQQIYIGYIYIGGADPYYPGKLKDVEIITYYFSYYSRTDQLHPWKMMPIPNTSSLW